MTSRRNGNGNKRAVVLVSGGADSATCLAVAVKNGFSAYALTVDYGQRHAIEIEAARRIGAELGAAEHRIVRVDLGALGGSALTDAALAVPKDRPVSHIAADIPITYVPARNTVFLSIALGWAETLGARDVFIGANAVDYSGYPDCRPAFLEAFARLAEVATVAGLQGAKFRIHAPLLRMTKAEVFRTGVGLGVDFALTRSCYDPDGEGRACARCDACTLRRRGFDEAGIPDPTQYVPSPAPAHATPIARS